MGRIGCFRMVVGLFRQFSLVGLVGGILKIVHFGR